MKRYIKVGASSKNDIFRQATEQRNLNEIYMSLNSLIDAMNGLSNEKFDELGLSQFYKMVVDKYQDMYKYYKP